MTEKQQTIEQIFLEAAEVESGARKAFLDARCSGLPSDVRTEVEMLLDADQQESKLVASKVNPHLNFANLLSTFANDNEQAGQSIGPYKLLEKLGEGGMGVVYMADQETPVQRRVALKLIKPGMDSKQVIARFESERQALAMMEHPNIAKVYDAGTTESGRPYFVMELVKGLPITDYCEQKKLDTKQRLAVFVSVCQAVAHAHQKGIIHRDIKPSNVLLAEYDDELVPKVIDFGVAKATSQKLTDKTAFTGFGQLVGTFEYMSPEQAKLNQLDVDTRTDVYSLGVLLYQLVTGTTPFDSQRLRSAALDEIVRIIAEEEPPKPSTRVTNQSARGFPGGTERRELVKSVESEVDWIVMKSLEKSRDRRYQTARDFAEDVRRHLAGDTVEACPPTMSYRTGKFFRKYRSQAIVIASMLVFLTASSAVGWILYRQASQSLLVERSTRAAAQASALMERQPVQSLQHAIDAVEISNQLVGSQVSLSHDALRKATLELGGEPLVGHRSKINSASFSCDNRWLVTGGGSNDGARLWDLQSPGKAFWLPHSNANVRHAVISSDSRWIATAANDGSVRLWNLQATDPSESSVELKGFENTFFTSLVISDNSQRLVAGTDDGAVAAWDLTSKAPRKTRCLLLNQAKGNTKARVDISADGRYLVSGSHQKVAYLWDLDSGSPTVPKFTFPLDEALTAIAISCEARWLVTGGESPRLWDLTAEAPTQSSQALWYQKGVSSVAITNDGKLLAIAGWEGTACLYDLTDEVPSSSCLVFRGHKGSVRNIGISQDHRWLITGGGDHKVRLWDLTSVEGKDLPTLQNGNGTTARMWFADTETGVSHQLHGHDGWVNALATSVDSQLLATGDWVGNLRLWNLDQANPAGNRVAHGRGAVQALSVSPDGNWLAVGRDGSSSRLWRLDESGTLREATELSGTPDGIGSLHISGDSRWLIATSALPAFLDASDYERNERLARVWDLTAMDPSKPVYELNHSGSVRAVAMSGNGKYAVTGSSDTTVKVWDLSNGSEIQTFECGYKVSTVAVDFTGKRVAIGCHGGHAFLWDLSSDRPVKHTLRKNTEFVLKIAISPNGRWLATGGSKDRPRIWDLNSPKPKESRVIPGHEYYTTSVTFSPDSQWLATGSWSKGKLSVWNLQADDPIEKAYASHETGDGIDSISFSSDSGMLLAGGFGMTRLLDLANPRSVVNLPIYGPPVALTPRGRYAIARQETDVRLSSTSIEDQLSYAKRLLGE